MSNVLKLLIVDDHRLFVEGLVSLLRDYPAISVAGKASNGIEAFELIPLLQPDCMLLDLRMPEMDGWETFDIISAKFPALKIIILTMDKDTETTKYFIEKGAVDVLDKSADIVELVKKITKSVSKTLTLSSPVKTQLYSSSNLTIRQIEILLMISQGKPHKIIADELDISESTVEYHKKALYEKLKVKSNAELTQYAIKKGYMRA